MTKRFVFRLALLTVLGSASVLAFSVPSSFREIRTAPIAGGHDEQPGDNGNHNGWFRGAARLPSGHYVTPTAIDDAVQTYLNPQLPAYPDFVAGMAVRSRLSPDGETLAILTAGQNSLYKPDGTVDVAELDAVHLPLRRDGGRPQPSLKQVIKQVNAHVGLVFSPDGNTLYAAGGNDDAVYVYTKSGDSFAPAPPIALGHYPPGATGSARNSGVGINVQPNASGMDVSADGRTLVVANNYNDSISVIDTATRTVRYEHDLRPYFANNEGQQGGVGGTFPFGVAIKGNDTAYVSSDRDRQVVVVDVSSPTAGRLIRRIQLDGNALGMTLDAVAVQALRGAGQCRPGRGDQHARRTRLVAKIDARAPAGMLPRASKYTGAATSAVTISPDGDTLYAVNSGSNSIAVIPLTGRKRPLGERPDSHRLRAARHHVQRRWLVDVHHQRQERHRAESGPPGEQHRPDHPHPVSRAAMRRRPRPRARRTSTSSSWSARRSSALPCRAGTISTSSPSRSRATTSTRPRPASATSASCASSTSASSTSSTS